MPDRACLLPEVACFKPERVLLKSVGSLQLMVALLYLVKTPSS